RSSTTERQRLWSASERADLTWPTVWVAKSNPPPGLSMICSAIRSSLRAQGRSPTPPYGSGPLGPSMSTSGNGSSARSSSLAASGKGDHQAHRGVSVREAGDLVVDQAGRLAGLDDVHLPDLQTRPLDAQ